MGCYDFEHLYTYVPEKRRRHTEGTEKCCLLLAEYFYPSLDTNELKAAAIMHDATKYYTAEQAEELCSKHGIDIKEPGLSSPRVVHQLTGSLFAADCGLSADSCSAIRWHTTGKENMKPMEKLLMLADYIEPHRDYDCVGEIRDYLKERCNEKDPLALEKTLIIALNFTIKEIIERNELIHPDSIKARNYLIAQCY